ncbi:MAG: TraB/GumN family protein [Rhodanobacter sp.]
MRVLSLAVLFTLTGLLPAHAQSSPARALPSSSDNVAELAAVTVSGAQPGPRLWKVSRGNHVLWVLGTQSPLPRDMQWQSSEVAEVISQSQQVLLSPSIKVKADVSFFGKLFLLPLAYSARKNANGETLQQVVGAPSYARWLMLKQKYIGRDGGIERWRPIFAGQELYKKALKANGLSKSGQVEDTVKALAKQHGVETTPVRYQVAIEHPRQAIKTFKKSSMDEAGCFSRTLDSIEQDMPAIKARANAWARGDLQTLRQLPDSHRQKTCVSAVTSADFAHQLGFDDVPQKLEEAWLIAARSALQHNAQSLALLPIDQLLSPSGYLTRLAAQGYRVESPQEQDAEPSSTGGDDSHPAIPATVGVP